MNNDNNNNNNNVIGLVGGYGIIGTIIAKELIKDKGMTFLIEGRNRYRIDELVKELGVNANGMAGDINNDSSLQDICKACSIIVNTSGTSSVVKDKVIEYATKEGCGYLCPGIWHDKENVYHGKFKEQA